MKKSLYLLIFICTFLSAQNQRFIYEYSFVADSANKADVQKEMLVLDVNPEGSEFYSYEKFKSDSIVAGELLKQSNSDSEIINVKEIYKGKIFYTVSKTYPKSEPFLFTAVGSDRYKVSDNRRMNWKILPEKQKAGEFETQKAEMDMYGRKWTAWFATDIPIQDGPYKFHGLPGLIVKVEDKSGSHSFELKGISRFAENNKAEVEAQLNSEKEIPINYAQYKKLILEEFNDPTKSLRKLISEAGANFKIFDSNGAEIKPADMIRQRELKSKENRKKNNNPLELDLLK